MEVEECEHEWTEYESEGWELRYCPKCKTMEAKGNDIWTEVP